jgi:peptidoglycan/LPS O-acetylase OafA/YrhL
VLVALPLALLSALLWKTFAPGLLADWIYHGVSPTQLVFFDPITGRPGPFPLEMMRFFIERQLPGEIAAFALGMAAANLYTRIDTRERSRMHALALDGVALVVLALTTLILIRLSLPEVMSGALWRLLGMPLFLTACTLLVLVAAVQTPIITALFTNPILMPIGILSYSLFLWHEPILRLVARGWWIPHWCAGAACHVLLALTLALLVAAISFRLTERWPRPGPTQPKPPAR